MTGAHHSVPVEGGEISALSVVAGVLCIGHSVEVGVSRLREVKSRTMIRNFVDRI